MEFLNEITARVDGNYVPFPEHGMTVRDDHLGISMNRYDDAILRQIGGELGNVFSHRSIGFMQGQFQVFHSL